MNRPLKEKHPQCAKRHDKVILFYDNARPHVAKQMKEILKALGWDVLPYPPYSPDIAPSYYYLFRSMQHDLFEQYISYFEDIKKLLDDWIASKELEFFYRWIYLLSEKWEKIVVRKKFRWTILWLKYQVYLFDKINRDFVVKTARINSSI